ncbi:hypothetical protein J1N35_021799 [Gossypium stocksii]|uniref:Kinesin light chain n=1 Tax=Gossypium stocksii TaxID=47602 RepID=A0A9D3VFI3_9ROSI|nr:hypothetical protein J1N35_021799 [Gossypium stocksii]
MSLHVLAAIYSSLGRLEEAVPVLKLSIEVPLLGNRSDHALAKFSGCMQLGETYSMMCQLDRSINSYQSGLRIQIEALGDLDPGTCRRPLQRRKHNQISALKNEEGSSIRVLWNGTLIEKFCPARGPDKIVWMGTY